VQHLMFFRVFEVAAAAVAAFAWGGFEKGDAAMLAVVERDADKVISDRLLLFMYVPLFLGFTGVHCCCRCCCRCCCCCSILHKRLMNMACVLTIN
jgi:hypothetical protein